MEDEKRQKRMKWAAYITAFAIFQVIVILVFALVVMKVRTPKFRIGNFEIQNLSTNPPSRFEMSFIAPIRVKNANFGPYKYDATTFNFTYGSAVLAQMQVPKSKANFRSTKKIDIPVYLNSNVTNVVPNLTSGTLTLNSMGTMNGKVEMMLIFKKKKSTSMNCTMVIIVGSKALQSLNCK